MSDVKTTERKFREYIAAIVDNDTCDAAKIYANYADDEDFVKLVNAYHDLSPS